MTARLLQVAAEAAPVFAHWRETGLIKILPPPAPLARPGRLVNWRPQPGKPKNFFVRLFREFIATAPAHFTGRDFDRFLTARRFVLRIEHISTLMTRAAKQGEITLVRREAAWPHNRIYKSARTPHPTALKTGDAAMTAAASNSGGATAPVAPLHSTERGCVADQPQQGVKPTNRERAAADAPRTAALRPV